MNQYIEFIFKFAKTKLENRNVTRKRRTVRRTGNFATLVVRRHAEHANENLHLQHPEFPTKSAKYSNWY